MSFCKGCETYSLTFNNVFFQFELEELIQFKKYISKVDTEYWLTHYANTTQKRKIPIQTYHQNLILLFNVYEFEELKVLLKIKNIFKKEVLSPEDVDYTLILN
ncbi:hypothetical protein CW731_03710 [Polaribacter sp. ALD11]|nr:hypothetical protein CW731_03710 [Polaribacter sp. ALD11]